MSNNTWRPKYLPGGVFNTINNWVDKVVSFLRTNIPNYDNIVDANMRRKYGEDYKSKKVNPETGEGIDYQTRLGNVLALGSVPYFATLFMLPGYASMNKVLDTFVGEGSGFLGGPITSFLSFMPYTLGALYKGTDKEDNKYVLTPISELAQEYAIQELLNDPSFKDKDFLKSRYLNSKPTKLGTYLLGGFKAPANSPELRKAIDYEKRKILESLDYWKEKYNKWDVEIPLDEK